MPNAEDETAIARPRQRTRRRKRPAGAQALRVAAADGCALRAMAWPASQARGSVLIVPGRTEFIERYYETVADLRDRGLAAAVIDMRNHGLSDRPLPRRDKHHLNDFGIMIDDVRRYAAAAAAAALPEPYYALGQSMGGHVVLRTLHRHPRLFAKAVLSAPMIDIAFAPLPRGLVAALARIATALGAGRAYAFGQGGYDPSPKARAKLQALLTSDAERYGDEAYHLAREPDLALGGVTFGWLAAALASIAELRAPGVPEAIATPCLFALAGADTVVDNDAARRLAARMPSADIVEIPGALHEILRERDRYRDRFWNAFDPFITTL